MPAPLFYHLALLQVPLIGPVQAKILLQHFTAEDIFKAKRAFIEKIDGIGAVRAQHIKQFSNFQRIEEEIRFLEKYNISPLLYTDPAYPQRLLKFHDAPTVLYYKGNAPLNHDKNIAVVGSRSHSSYGKEVTEELVKNFAPHGIQIISGMAAGIDAIAHKAALSHRLPTIGVLAHGLDRIYPAQHASLAKEILKEQGGLLTEFMSTTEPERYHFPRRNRIVAGISDSVIIVETSEKGGSMITAQIARQYKKPLFALPGKITDVKSKGCNILIRDGSACLLQGAQDLLQALNWAPDKKMLQGKTAATQLSMMPQLTPEEQSLVNLLHNHRAIHIDDLKHSTALTNSSIAAAILSLELQNIIQALPGKMYALR